MRHNLKSSRREHPGSGTDSWGGSVIRLWNQKHLAEKTCALKGVKPQLICEKHLNTPSKPKLSPVRKILDNTVHPTGILCFFIFWWNLTKCNPCVYRAQSIAVLQRVKKSVCVVAHMACVPLYITKIPLYVTHARKTLKTLFSLETDITKSLLHEEAVRDCTDKNVGEN